MKPGAWRSVGSKLLFTIHYSHLPMQRTTQMIEEDFFFPGTGKPIDDDESAFNVDAASILTPETSVSNGTTTLGLRPMPQIDEQKMVKSFSDSCSTAQDVITGTVVVKGGLFERNRYGQTAP